MLHVFIWGAPTSIQGPSRRALFDVKIAELPLAQGGFGAPNLRLVLLWLAVDTVLRWSRALVFRAQVVCAALISAALRSTPKRDQPVYLYPLLQPPRTFRLGSSLWATGSMLFKDSWHGTWLTLPRTLRFLWSGCAFWQTRLTLLVSAWMGC